MSSSLYRIGFITLEAINAYTTQLWLGVNDCATHFGLNLITFGGFQKAMPFTMYGDSALIDTSIDPLNRLVDVKSLDGVIIWTAGILKDHTYAKQFLAPYQAVPTVSIGVDTAGVNRVLMDGYQGMAQLVSHLITNCGRRDIAFITGTPTNLDAQNRRQAYEDTLRRHGLPVREEYIVPGVFAWNSREIGKQAASTLFDRRALRPDAIVASSDDLAIGALEAVRQRGIRIPEEISITGFDDIPDCTSVYPTLTTVSQATYELAWSGVEMLLSLIQGKPTEERISIPTRVVLRHSCGSHLKTAKTRASCLVDKAAVNPSENSHADSGELLAEYLFRARPSFRAIFDETHSVATLEKVDLILAAFEHSILTAEPTHFVSAIQSLVYNLQERKELEQWSSSLLRLVAQVGFDIATIAGVIEQLHEKTLITVCLDLLATKTELIFEQALSSLDREQHVRDQYQLAQLQMLNRNLLIPYDSQRLAEIFAQQLPQLGIDLAYVAIFTSFDQPTDEVRLIVAYDRQKNLAEAPQDSYFRASELSSGIPILQDRHMNLVAIPIYSANIYAGFVLFSFGPRNYQFYTQLSSTLGYNIVNSTLLEQVRAHASQLEQRIIERTTDLVVANTQLHSEITEKNRIEQELEAARDQALEVSRMKSEFLATMSHEIRTPMNGILGMTELLLDTQLDEEQHSFAEVAYEEGLKLLEIINSILDFSKIEAGKIVLEEVEFVLADQIQSVVKLLNLKAKSKGLTLLSAIAPDVPKQVIGDSVRFGQILMNLIGNAIKFTETGEVFVTIQRDPNQSSTLPTPDEVIQFPLQITVRDTGIGMSHEAVENLFTPFTQADSSTTRRYGGTGLGLAITKRLVDLMGGTVIVDSKPDVGSTFTISLSPRCRQEVYLAATEKSQTSAPSYLLVSSDPALCRQLTSYLETWAIQAKPYGAADSSNVAILLHLYQYITQDKHYPAIIIDQQNSMIEPCTFARSIHADPLLKHSQLLLITRNRTPNFQQQVIDAGFDGMINPPVTQSALHQQISHLVPKSYGGLLGCDETHTPQIATEALPMNRENLILLVEDYVSNQRLALAYLKKLGYAAHVVEDGQAAVDAIVNHGDLYRLVLMDWHLPVIDGLQATEMIRQHEKQSNHHIPIIGMTANALKGDRERCIEAGMDDYISKPVKREELGCVLNNWLLQNY